MYLQDYGLSDSPFPSLPTVEYYFDSDRSREGLAAISSAVARQAGPNLILGAPGTGKTMMLEVLAKRYSGGRIVVFLRDLKIGSRRELLQNLLFELGLEFQGIDDGELRLALLTALRSDSRLASGVLVLLDEAHLLSTEILDQLRILSNVIRDGHSQIQWILAGNNSLEETLAAPELASFNQQIAARLYLRGFSLTDVEKYVEFQWRRAGGTEHPFLPDALHAIHTATNGIPRLINQLCEAVLEVCPRNVRGRIDETVVQKAWANWQQIPIPEWLQASTPSTQQDTEYNVQPGVVQRGVVQFGSLDDADDDAAPIAKKGVTPTDEVISQEAQPPEDSAPATNRHEGDDSRSTIQDAVAAQQVAQTQALIRFAFEADIQKPRVPDLLTQTDGAATPEPYLPQIQRMQEKIDVVQQALDSLEQAGNPIDQMLIEADLEAVVHPVDRVTESESEPLSPAVISNDPTMVFQDHLYMENLWVQNTVWSRLGQIAEVGVQPTDRHDDLAPESIPYPSIPAAQAPPAEEAVLDSGAPAPKPTLPLGIRIDQESESGVNPPQSIKRWAPVPSIDSPQIDNWRNTLSDVPASDMTLPTAAFQDDASIIHRQAIQTPMSADETAQVHAPQILEPPVLARRKDLRALLHALRGY